MGKMAGNGLRIYENRSKVRNYWVFCSDSPFIALWGALNYK